MTRDEVEIVHFFYGLLAGIVGILGTLAAGALGAAVLVRWCSYRSYLRHRRGQQ